MASKMYWRSDKIPLLSLSSSLIHALLFNRVTSRKWLFNQVVQRDFLIFFFFLELEKVKNAAGHSLVLERYLNIFPLVQRLGLLA